VSEALSLKISILAGDFTKILLPLATNLSTFGQSTRIVSQTLCTCNMYQSRVAH
jgi:hypothetical protein